MKTVLSAVVAAVIGFAAAYAFVSSQSEARLKQERTAHAAEKERLEAALAAAEKKSGQVRTVEVPGPTTPQAALPAKLTPQEILDLLVKIHPGSGGSRAHDIRMVIFYLQMLADDGRASLAPIKQFFAKNVDVDYSVEDNGGNNSTNNNNGFNRGQGRGGGGRGFAFGFRRGQQLRMDFVLPPSLRLGLVDVVKEIGGLDAEKLLAGVLQTTGRGVEVAYLAHTLEDLAPGKYRELALSSAKELLLNLPTIDDPNRYDENAKGYLYSVLEMYNDASFAAKAQTLLISDGRIDRDAMNYLSQVLKDQSVATLYAAYKDQRLTNQFERTALAGTVLNYAGQNPQANALFGEIVNNADLNPGLRAMAIMRLAGGAGGPFAGESPTDPQVIAARKQLLSSIDPNTADERIVQAAELAGKNLDHLLAGEPLEQPNFRGFFGGGGGGGGRRGNRGGGGGQNQQGQ